MPKPETARGTHEKENESSKAGQQRSISPRGMLGGSQAAGVQIPSQTTQCCDAQQLQATVMQHINTQVLQPFCTRGASVS